MSDFNAWHLPGIASDELKTETLDAGESVLRVPAPTGAQLATQITQLITNADRWLRTRPVQDIVAAIDAAARRIASPSSPEGEAARRILPAVTGYSIQTIDDVLNHMTQDWSTESLELLLRSELDDPAKLDSYAVSGPRFAFHVFSGNVPGIAVTSIIRSLLVKAPTLGKTASGEPVLPVLFARALQAVAPEIAQCLAVTYWPGGSSELEQAALDAADCVVVYGGDEAVRSIAARVKANTRLLVHGPRMSFGVVGSTPSADVAEVVARAVAAYDQQGCVSPHVIYVEGDARALADSVAQELATLADTHPRRRLSVEEAMAIRDVRARFDFRAPHLPRAEVFASEDTAYTVIYDEDTAFTPSCLNRTVFIKPVVSVLEVPALIGPYREVLQSAAVNGIDEKQLSTLIAMLLQTGVTRLTSFEKLPWPPMWWHHDGRGPLTELLTCNDVDI
jgi:hypothetical protein